MIKTSSYVTEKEESCYEVKSSVSNDNIKVNNVTKGVIKRKITNQPSLVPKFTYNDIEGMKKSILELELDDGNMT